MLRLLQGSGWLPPALLAAGELLHALPNQEAAALLLEVWHSLQPSVAPSWPLEIRGVRRGYSAVRPEPDEVLSASSVRELLMSLLHNHIGETGPQYGRFLQLLGDSGLPSGEGTVQGPVSGEA